MRITAAALSALVVIACWCPRRGFGEEADRLVAAVNGRVITEGDLKLAANLNALVLFGKKTAEVPSVQELNRLIDLELLRQELHNFPVASADDQGVQQKLDELIQGYAEIGGLSPLLRRLGLQQSELEAYLRLQASILRFVDLRFRPFIGVEKAEVQAYYDRELAPALAGKGASVPPIDEVSGEIEHLLQEQKVNAALDQWVEDVRRHSRIEFFGEPPAPEVAR